MSREKKSNPKVMDIKIQLVTKMKDTRWSVLYESWLFNSSINQMDKIPLAKNNKRISNMSTWNAYFQKEFIYFPQFFFDHGMIHRSYEEISQSVDENQCFLPLDLKS